MNNDITDRIVTENIIAGGWNYSRIIRRGQTLRLTDIEGGGNVSAMFYNAANFSERFNLGDTLKIQHICRLTRNCCIYSDMGRILMSVPEDTCGWHDMLCGCAHAALIEKKFGKKEYQEAHNDFYRNGYDSLLVELGKHGMTKRDFTEIINFFSKVVVDDTGAMSFVENNSKPGSYVDLRAEIDTLVVLDTGMHPLSPARNIRANRSRRPCTAANRGRRRIPASPGVRKMNAVLSQLNSILREVMPWLLNILRASGMKRMRSTSRPSRPVPDGCIP